MSLCSYKTVSIPGRCTPDLFHDLRPPRLEMDAYADFVAQSLKQTDLKKAARQKAIEERIVTPFRLH